MASKGNGREGVTTYRGGGGGGGVKAQRSKEWIPGRGPVRQENWILK